MTTKPNEKYIEEFIQGIAEIVQKKIESGKATFFVSKDEPHQEPSAEDQLYELKADISNGVGFLFVDALQKKGELYKLIKKLRQSTIDDVVERVNELDYAGAMDSNESRRGYDTCRAEVLAILQSQTTVQEEKCMVEIPTYNDDGTEKDSDYWIFCLKEKPCPIHDKKVAEPNEILKKEV